MQLNVFTIVLSLQPHKIQVSKGVKNVDPTDCAQNLTKWPYCARSVISMPSLKQAAAPLS